MKEQCSREVEQLCVVEFYMMLKCNEADVQIDAGTNLRLNSVVTIPCTACEGRENMPLPKRRTKRVLKPKCKE